jgi:SAM-dependent methyltransferase
VKIGDAYGAMLLDAVEGKEDILEIVERDDGLIMAGRFGPALYLAPFRRWPARQRQAMKLARGRVLDVGSGGGRVAVHLQGRGLEVVSIDSSPGAVEASLRHGAKDVRLLRIEEVTPKLRTFDTVVMFGNNLGLLGSHEHGRRLLRRLARVTNPDARILGETLDPYTTENPLHLAYHARNRRRGRMSGQVRIRLRYLDLASPWFDYLFLSREELEELVDGTGWRLADAITDDSPIYVAVLERR